jgi:hypothetical protein
MIVAPVITESSAAMDSMSVTAITKASANSRMNFIVPPVCWVIFYCTGEPNRTSKVPVIEVSTDMMMPNAITTSSALLRTFGMTIPFFVCDVAFDDASKRIILISLNCITNTLEAPVVVAAQISQPSVTVWFSNHLFHSFLP